MPTKTVPGKISRHQRPFSVEELAELMAIQERLAELKARAAEDLTGGAGEQLLDAYEELGRDIDALSQSVAS